MDGSSSLKKATIALLVIESLLIFVPLVILRSAINWPASLDEPASANLPLIVNRHVPVALGYGFHLVYSLLFFVVAFLTGRVVVGRDLQNPLFKIATAFALLSTFARVLGVARWLLVMPLLGELYLTGTPEIQQTVSLLYQVVNAYLGGVGELFGVGLFAIVWLVLTSVLINRSKELPNWLGYIGYAASISMSAPLLEVAGIDVGPMISISVATLHLWMLITAIVFYAKKDLKG